MQITEDDINRFTKGDCHVLAKRLHRVANLPLHCLVILEDGNKHTRHAFVIVGNKVLDVEGLQSVRSFKKRWRMEDEKRIAISQPLTIDWFWERWTPKGTSFGHHSYKRAREIADYLLEKYSI